MYIRKILSSTFLVILCQSAVAGSHHQTLGTYDELEKSLAEGDNVKAIVDFTKCSPMVDSMGSMSFSTFNKYIFTEGAVAKETIATLTTVMTHTRKFGYINNTVRMRVFKDNSVEILNEFIDPKNYIQITSTSYTCQLNNGVTLYLME